MPTFNYTALDSKGDEKKGVLESETQSSAINQLREMGLFPTHVAEVGGGKKKSEAPQGPGYQSMLRPAKKKGGGTDLFVLLGGSGVSQKVLCVFTRQLATLVDAGLPLLKGLSILEKQEKNVTLKGILGELAGAVESGSTFSEALDQHKKVFSKLYVNMVRAGEVGGVLEVVLNRLAIFMEKAEKIKGKIKAAMFYPIAVLFVAVVIMTFLMVKIVPQFETIFADMLGNVELPQFTQFVIGTSRAIKTHFLVILGAVGGFFVALSIFAKTNIGGRLIDQFLLTAPLFGNLVRKASIARFTRTLGTLVSSGVPILQSLQITRDTSGNRVVSDAVGKIHDSVKEGESIVRQLEACGVFPPMVVSMVEVGENTGALPDMLIKIADNYDEEVDIAVQGLLSLLEPIMIVILAVVVGSIVIALFLPMIKIIQTLGQGGG